MKYQKNRHLIFTILATIVIILAGCGPKRESGYILPETLTEEATQTPEATATPASKRPVYSPGTLVDYIAQSDSLSTLFVRLLTSRNFANPQIPEDVTTLPPGFPMKMPIYYKGFGGPSFRLS